MKGQLRLLSGKRLNSPVGSCTRPTTSKVREAMINILKERIFNSNWLDLFSGSGIIGCEAIEHGATSVFAIESNKKAFRICKSNLLEIASSREKEVVVKALNTGAIKFLKTGYNNFIEKEKLKNGSFCDQFNFVYLDPPYKKSIYSIALNQLLIGNWVSKECLAICEYSKEEDLIAIPPTWNVKDQKTYGKTGLLFLTPNQA